jgi:hypothetical protein
VLTILDVLKREPLLRRSPHEQIAAIDISRTKPRHDSAQEFSTQRAACLATNATAAQESCVREQTKRGAN